MTFTTQLRIPGPTPLPERIVRAMNRPLIDHRGPEFAAILAEATAGAKRVFKTKNDLLLLTSSGTGGLESAVANLVSPGDEVVVALCGNFGERFAALASAYGADVVRLEFEWGQPVDAGDLELILQRHPKPRVVLFTHNETSTGLTNPLRELARTARSAERLVVVDGVSSISSIDIETDAWGIDVAVSGSQKGWMAPPGLALVSVSERAWAQQARARSPRFYFDWKEAKAWAEKGMTPFTPAVPVAFAMQEGLRMLEEEGLANVYDRHARLARATQAGLQALGFQLFAAEGFRSHTVTSASSASSPRRTSFSRFPNSTLWWCGARLASPPTSSRPGAGSGWWAGRESGWTTSTCPPLRARASWSSTPPGETSWPLRSTR